MYGDKTIVKLVLVVFLSCFAFGKGDKFDENLYIIKALMAVENSQHEQAVELYEKLYEKTKNTTYLKEALRLAFFSKNVNFKSILQLSEKVLKDDTDVLRIKGMEMMSENRLDEAKEAISALVKKENISKNYIMLSAVYAMQNDFKSALTQLEKAYELDRSEENLFRIVDMLYIKLKDKDEAIRYLESARRIDGCTEQTCLTLIDLYAEQKRFSQMVSVYEGLYEATKEKSYLDKALGVYVYQQNYDAAIKFLQKYNHNDDALMDVYAAKGEFNAALKKAKEVFARTNDPQYQAKMAVYQYERDSANGKKIGKNSLKEVMQNFEKSVPNSENAVFLNYYGYLLIDHDIDVKKGINLVQKALNLEPNSAAYLDSLAWGYYKLKECKKADETMQKTMHDTEFISTDEAKEHIRLIKECAKAQK